MQRIKHVPNITDSRELSLDFINLVSEELGQKGKLHTNTKGFKVIGWGTGHYDPKSFFN